MSAITQRSRRATAGKRMTDLVGKAQEDDEAFWNHDTWAEDDSGNDSFSDNDSAQQVDVFDSDFNDSESDNEEEEQAAGQAAEKEIAKEDRSSKKKGGYIDKNAPKKKKIGRRIVGDGLNAGLVLNIPGQAVAPPIITRPADWKPQPVGITPKRRKLEPIARRTTRESKTTVDDTTAAARKSPVPSTAVSKKKRERFSQEQLLHEAATVTEPENQRWLLARKRNQSQKEVDNHKVQEKKNVVQTYSSRKGSLNTIHFWDMDHLPPLLTPKAAPSRPKATQCAITGKKARYKDPKTGLGYHDAQAFKELRRRYNAGELGNQDNAETKAAGRSKKAKPSNSKPTLDTGALPPPASASAVEETKPEVHQVSTEESANGNPTGPPKPPESVGSRSTSGRRKSKPTSKVLES